MVKGSHMSEESRAKVSIARMGNTNARGNHWSEEARAKQSALHVGRKASPETKAKLSAGMKLRPKHYPSEEVRTKMSMAHMGHVVSIETRAKISVAKWRGGKKAFDRRSHAKRRVLGFVCLNEPFVGCEGHHVNQNDVIYIPKELHRSIYHRQSDGQGMEQINALAYEWLAREVK